jgi:hypothetical protein
MKGADRAVEFHRGINQLRAPNIIGRKNSNPQAAAKSRSITDETKTNFQTWLSPDSFSFCILIEFNSDSGCESAWRGIHAILLVR